MIGGVWYIGKETITGPATIKKEYPQGARL